jgi:hypothetical protein
MHHHKRHVIENNIMRVMRAFTTRDGQTFLPGTQVTVNIDTHFPNGDVLITTGYGFSTRVPQDAVIFFPATN